MRQVLSLTKKFSLVVFFNLAAIILMLAALEFAASFFVSKPSDVIVGDLIVNHTWRPNARFIHDEWVANNPDFPEPYVHRTNRQGWLENYDVEVAKPANTYRIFYVGDSFTEGTAPMDQSVPSLVETRLNAIAENGRWRYEVINTGTTSYSPTIYYLLVRYVLMKYSPDLIVVNVDMTDDFDDWKYSQTLVRDKSGDPLAAPPRDIYSAPFIDTETETIKSSWWLRAQIYLFENSYTYNFMRKLSTKVIRKLGLGPEGNSNPISLTESGARYERWEWCSREWEGQVLANARHTLDLLKRLALWLKHREVKLMLTSVPHYPQYASKEDGTGKPKWTSRPHKEIARISAENEVPYLDSFRALAGVIRGTPQTEFYYSGDMHFNPRGYAVWADAHFEFLSDPKNGLLPTEN